MDIGDLATKVVKKIVTGQGKKLSKKVTAPKLTKSEPIKMKNETDAFYNVGFSKKEVMPDDIASKAYWLAGYRTGNKVVGVLDPMTVSAMWIDCNTDGGVLLVSADCVGLTGYEVALARESLSDFSKKSGCKVISISCTHTHAGIDTVGYWGKLPKTGKDKDYMKKFLTAIKDVCTEAYSRRKPGKLYIGSIPVPEAIKDSRDPIVLNEKLTRLRFVPDDNTTETWFLNFGAHPNTLGGANSKVSADYPYYLREKINETQKTNVLFGVNAIAAITPADLPNGEDDNFKRTMVTGHKLAEAAFKIDNDKELTPEMTVLQQPYLSPVDNAILAFMKTLHVINSIMVPDERSSIHLALQTELIYLKLGEQQILYLPGEALPEFVYGGYFTKEASPTGEDPSVNPKPLVEIAEDKELLIFGVSNDMTGYIVPKNDFILHPTQAYLSTATDKFGKRHYQETNSLGIQTAQTIADVFADMMKRIKSAKK